MEQHRNMIELEEAKQKLREELECMPHTRFDLLGNAACGRKIRNIIIAYIFKDISQSECTDEIKALMIESGVLEKNFEEEIKPYIDVNYKAKELIDKGYCNEIKN